MKIPESGVYLSKPKWFGVPWRNSVLWENCRDELQTMKPRKFFYHHEGKQKYLIKFIKKIQDKLKLKKGDRLKISTTENPQIIHINLSKFWFDQLRFSFLTACLRVGHLYYPGTDYLDTIKQNPYLDETILAVQRFLDGYTCAKVKKFTGWFDLFDSASLSILRKKK